MQPFFVPTHAMVLAAGLGQRMRPITDHTPKPLVSIGGKPMLDHALDRLADVGVRQAVVNVHHLAERIEEHVAMRLANTPAPSISISDERAALLETGGGLTKALPLLGDQPFFHLNSDSLWVEGATSNLMRMARSWDPACMDMLLLLADRARSMGYDGAGDFHMAPHGALSRRKPGESVPHIYAGVAIIKPELLKDAPPGSWSLNLVFDRLIGTGRLHGLVLDGEWLHVGTPEAIPEAEARFAAFAG